jgi:hypothetical protein
VGFRQESNSSGLVEPEILSSDARRIHVRLRRGVCQTVTDILRKISVIPVTWQNWATEVSKLKLKEMGSR